MATTDGVFQTEQRGAVLAGFMNRPEVHNAMDTELRSALAEFWRTVRDTPEVRVALVAGVPGASFSAGRDLKETARAYDAGFKGADWELVGQSGYPSAISVGKPIVAAVDRYCVGAGLKVAVDADIRIGTPESRYGTPQVKVGRGTESPIYLHKIGLPAAVVRDMVMTGELIDADTALRYGLISRIVEKPALLDEAWRIATVISEGSPAVVEGAKRGIDAGIPDLPTDQAGELWRYVTGMFGDTNDAKLGAAAFSQKTQAKFN